MAHTVLSLDLGSNLGWSLIIDNVVYKSGMGLFRKDASMKLDHDGAKFLKFQEWLEGFNGVDEVFFEDVKFINGFHAQRTYNGFLGILMAFLCKYKLKASKVAPNTWKKTLCGNGHADKFEVCKVLHGMGWKGGAVGTNLNNDEADSIGVAYHIFYQRDLKLRF